MSAHHRPLFALVALVVACQLDVKNLGTPETDDDGASESVPGGTTDPAPTSGATSEDPPPDPTEGTGETGAMTSPDTGDDSADDTGAPGICPSVSASANWWLSDRWNDGGPSSDPAQGGVSDKPNLRIAPCTVVAVSQAPNLMLDLSCVYELDGGEVEPRAHRLEFGLPPGSVVDIAVGEEIHLRHEWSPGINSSPRWHLELTRAGAPLLLATVEHDQGGECNGLLQLLTAYADLGLEVEHATCDPALHERLDFTVGEVFTSVYHGQIGSIGDGLVAVVANALHEFNEELQHDKCAYQVLVYREAQ